MDSLLHCCLLLRLFHSRGSLLFEIFCPSPICEKLKFSGYVSYITLHFLGSSPLFPAPDCHNLNSLSHLVFRSYGHMSKRLGSTLTLFFLSDVPVAHCGTSSFPTQFALPPQIYLSFLISITLILDNYCFLIAPNHDAYNSTGFLFGGFFPLKTNGKPLLSFPSVLSKPFFYSAPNFLIPPFSCTMDSRCLLNNLHVKPS